MVARVKYCPLSNSICQHEPVRSQPNTFFLIQPFDSEKRDREKAIKRALRKVYTSNNYELKKSDTDVKLSSSYCDICLKIKSSQMCIADVSGESFVIDVDGDRIKKVFLRPNVAFELGLAYGFNKPSLIISREIEGQRVIPSDISFTRYIDVKFRNWESASTMLADRLKGNITVSLVKEPPELKEPIDELIKYFTYLIHLKENYENLTKEIYNMMFITYRNNILLGVVKNHAYLKEGICFKLFVTENGIESLKGRARVFHIQPMEGLAQLAFYDINDNEEYWKKVIDKAYYNREDYALGMNRLELIVPEPIKRISIENMRSLIDALNRAI